MADGRNVGIAAAVEAIEAPGIGAPTAVQPDFLDFDGPEGAEGPVSAVVERRGRGRPLGSANKRTEDLRRFVLSRYKHPVVAAAELYSLPVDELATHLGCDRLDAAVLQLKAMDFVAPYVDSKMPTKVAVTGEMQLPAFHLHLDGRGGARAVGPGGQAVDIVELAMSAKRAMDQRLIEGEAARSRDDAGRTEENP